MSKTPITFATIEYYLRLAGYSSIEHWANYNGHDKGQTKRLIYWWGQKEEEPANYRAKRIMRQLRATVDWVIVVQALQK